VDLPYNGLALDRAAGRRGDEAWLRGLRERQDALVIPLWRDQCLVSGPDGELVTIAMAEAAAALDGSAVPGGRAAPVFLGLDGETGIFAVDLSALDETAALRLAGASGVADTRSLFAALGAQRAAALAYARGLLRWHRDQGFCGECGAPSEVQAGGHQRACTAPGCGRLLFPRIEPAIIVVVEAPGPPPRCLLGRHRGAAADGYALIAGFVDIGESLEDAVRREVGEEAGVPVGEVRYQGSQAWPFPAGLMAGFRARATSDVIAVDHDELEEARWFTRPELAAHRAARPRTHGDSIGTFLLDAWLAEGGRR
jgi:NADH pyrophosphatase NudC (nudix superfamily)